MSATAEAWNRILNGQRMIPEIKFELDLQSAVPSNQFESNLANNLAAHLNAVISAADQIIKGPLSDRTRQSSDGRSHLLDTIVKTYATADHLEVSTTTNNPTAVFQEEDTGTRVIVPVNAKSLRFVSQGQTVFAARVMQPARLGTHSWKQAAEFVAETWPALVEQALKASLNGLVHHVPSAAELAGSRGNRVSAPASPLLGSSIRPDIRHRG
ncbi:MAG: hypothetical protein ACREDR_29290 [Blastocatellia bacterium]